LQHFPCQKFSSFFGLKENPAHFGTIFVGMTSQAVRICLFSNYTTKGANVDLAPFVCFITGSVAYG